MAINVDTIFPRQFMKILPLYYFPKLVLESSEIVRLVVGTTTHGRQLLDSLLRVDLMNEFVIESQISVDDLRRVKRASEFWHDLQRFPYPEMGDYIPAFLLLNGLNYTEVFKALYHCDVDEIFDEGGKVNVQDLKNVLKKKRPPTADMRMKLLLEGVFDVLGYPFRMYDVVIYRQARYQMFTRNVKDAFEPLLKRKTLEYFAKLEGVMYERARVWPTENEEVRKFYREVIEEQFSSCSQLFIKKGINWEKAQLNFEKSLDEYVSKEQLSRANANLRRVDVGIEKEAELFGVSPSLMQEIKGNSQLESYFKKFEKQPKRRPTATVSKGNNKDPVPTHTNVSMAKEALSCIRQGRFAGAADIFERMLNEKKEDPKHVYNARMARIFCLYRSSNFDKFENEVKLLCREKQPEECQYLPKYCLAYFYNERFDFKKSKLLAGEVDEAKFVQEQFPEWPEEGGFFDVLQFNKTSCNVASAEERKKALDRLRNPPNPVATCIYQHCNSSKREIYCNDPSSSDNYCSFLCTAKCTLEYHFSCWRKLKKECKENYDENSLVGSKCLTDSCDGKFETVTIFESNGRVKKRMVADHKGKAEQKAKKEKSKKKKNEMEKSDNNDGQTAKQGSSNSMSFAETSTRSEDDAEKRKDPQGKIKMDAAANVPSEQPLSSRHLQAEPEAPELVSRDQLRLLEREDHEDVHDGASKKKRRSRRQRGNSENKGLLSNPFDVLSIDETGDEKKVPGKFLSKRAKSNSTRVSSRTMSEASVSEANVASNIAGSTTNSNAQSHNDQIEEKKKTKEFQQKEQPIYDDWNLKESTVDHGFEQTNVGASSGTFASQPQELFGHQKYRASAEQSSSSGPSSQSTPSAFKNKAAFESGKPYKAQSKEQPLYGDWNFNEANFNEQGNYEKNLLPPSLGLNSAKSVSQPQQSLLREKRPANNYQPSSFADVPKTATYTSTENSIQNNVGRGSNSKNISSSGSFVSNENVHNFDSFSSHRSTTRGRGRGFLEASGVETSKTTKRINSRPNASNIVDERFNGGNDQASRANEPSVSTNNTEGSGRSGKYFGSVSFEMNTNSTQKPEGTCGGMDNQPSKVPKTGVFSMFNKAQGIKESGRSKFFESSAHAPTPKLENRTPFSQASTGNRAFNVDQNNCNVSTNDTIDRGQSTSSLNEALADRNLRPPITPETSAPQAENQNHETRQQNYENVQGNRQQNILECQSGGRPLPQQATQHFQASQFYPEGLDQFTEDRLTDEELRQLMTGGDNFMMAQRPRTTPVQNHNPAPPQTNSAFQAHSQQGSFYPHSQQAPQPQQQQSAPSFQPPFQFPLPSDGMHIQPPRMQQAMPSFASIPPGPLLGNFTPQFQQPQNPFATLSNGNNAMPGFNPSQVNPFQPFQRATNNHFFR